MVSKLDNNVNLTFNPYFLEKAIKNNLQIVECPITFFPRIGFSKGGNINNRVAMKLGLQMILEYSLAGRISLKNKYHETRIAYDLKRKVAWQTLVESYFAKFSDRNSNVLEVGAGYCDFINEIPAKKNGH